MMSHSSFLCIYQYTAHFLGCVLLLSFVLQIGVSTVKGITPVRVRVLLWACYLVVVVQVPISGVRIFLAKQGSIAPSDPLVATLNFFWSPMCTLVIIWVLFKYIATSAPCVRRRILMERVSATINYHNSFAFMMAGVLFSYILDKSSILGAHPHTPSLYTCISIALATSILEQLYHAQIKKRVSLISYSWVWFLGTWLYFLLFFRR